MKNPTLQIALDRIYMCADELNHRPISPRVASMQIVINLAEKLNENEISEERVAVALLDAAQNLLKL